MKKLNITKKQFGESKYFTKKYGTLKYVSESGKLYKTSKGHVITFVKESTDDSSEIERLMSSLDDSEMENICSSASSYYVELAGSDADAEMSDEDCLEYLREYMGDGDFLKWLRDEIEVQHQANESGSDIAHDPAYKCPYCGGHNCEFEDAQEPGEQQGYFDGSQFYATFNCLDCEKPYEVQFMMNVVASKPKF